MGGNLFIYAYYVLLARLVGVEGYGVVTALLSATLLLSAPATVAAAVIAKLAADLHAANDGARLRRLADVVDRLAWAISVAVFALAAAFTRPIDNFFHLASAPAVIVSAATLALLIVVTAQRAVLQGQHRFRSYAVSYLIDSVSRCALGAAGALFFGIVGAIGAVAIDLLLTAAFNSVAMRHGLPAPSSLNLPRRSFMSSAAQISFTLLAINAMLFYDTILVRHYFSAEIAGLYSSAALVARAVYAIVGFIPIVLLPSAARRAAQGERSIPLLLTAGGVVFAVGALAVGASIVAPRVLVQIIAGPHFIAAQSFVLPYVAALVALAAANAVANYKIGLGRFEHSIPLLIIALLQIAVVVLRHHSVEDVLQTILIGDVCAFVVTLYRLAPSSAGLRPYSLEIR